jgi:hypothetical protein
MPEPPPYTDIGDPADAKPERPPTSGMPRWVKVSLIVAAVIVVLVVVVLLVGGGPGTHGPSRHF